MASSVDVRFEDICRTCMGCSQENPADKTFRLQSIYDYVDVYKSRRMQIFELLNLTVQGLPQIGIMDEMPNNICTRCLERLHACFQFQNRCINSDLRLRKLIETSLDEDSKKQLPNEIDSIQTFIKEEIVPEECNIIQSKDYIGNCQMVSNALLRTNLNERIQTDIFDSPIAHENNQKQFEHKTGAETYTEVCQGNFYARSFLDNKSLLSHLEDQNSTCKHALNIKRPIPNEILIEGDSSNNLEDFQAYSNHAEFKNFNNQMETSAQFEPMQTADEGHMLDDQDYDEPTNKLQKNDVLPFKCKSCNKGFKYKCRLVIHEVKHTKEQSYVCSRCAKSFSNIEDLEQHAQLHEEENRFGCFSCGKKFRTYSAAYSHQRRKHENLLPLP